ncbi:MAG: PCMD domain-containing protein [Mucinivorans sp.]
MKNISLIIFALFVLPFCSAQSHTEAIAFGDFENWMERTIEESAIIGGQTKTVWAIAPKAHIEGKVIYQATVSPWGSSNVMAKVIGITKTSNSTFPDRRSDGQAAKLVSMMESCKVLGMINIEVLISGAIYLGTAFEPITSINGPYAKIDMGMPFSRHPKGIMFDYKTFISPSGLITRATGMSSIKRYAGDDCPEVFAYLQKRTEDKQGNIYAKRIATIRYRFNKNQPSWVNNFSQEFIYGDARESPKYKSYMNLIQGQNAFNARNSKGKIVAINENEWGDGTETPTHVILMFVAGYHGAFVGAEGNILWIDNIKFEY